MTTISNKHSKSKDIDGSKIHYLDIGEGPVILFGHSFLWDVHMWAEQIKELSKNYRCIVVDLWGHGKSGPLPESYKHLKDLAHSYHKFMRSLDIDKYVVIGLSVGGMWGTYLAALYPEEVKGLIIMDSYAGSEADEAREHYYKLIDSSINGISEELATQVAPFFFRKENPDANLLKTCAKHLMALDKNTQIPSVIKLSRIIFGRPNFLDQLTKIKNNNIEIEIIVGDQDIPRPPSEAKEMAALIGKSPIIIKNSGHIPTVEQPKETTQAIIKCLNRMKR